ncbi:helix-turn-helix domain-containing protein [Parafrankia elaeagni]|uniref:helix-turn-helix domain-containing protein n=1 Tax=Parafrankia elaeagni TaxID=222534 RepID=UPI00037B5026|nr:helix-turn-helix domain-containing protein [Parafrankia elaeagni]
MNTTRRRDAARSRQALLAAAADLFAERGYAGTAIRSVGDRAGVDPALIARYFGGKEGLYQAVLAADPLIGQTVPVSGGPNRGGPASDAAGSGGSAGEGQAEPPARSAAGAASPARGSAAASETPADPAAAVRALVGRALDRWTASGVSAAAQNVFRREVDAAARAATRERLDTVRLPLGETAAAPDPELAAELAVALLFGVGVARDAGTLTRLAKASAEDLREPLTAALLAALGITEPPQP